MSRFFEEIKGYMGQNFAGLLCTSVSVFARERAREGKRKEEKMNIH
jgi:hypothetical protein